jgi:hypothetical protein
MRLITLAGIALAVTLMASSSPALAHGKHKRIKKHHRHVVHVSSSEYRAPVVYRVRRFVVPTRIRSRVMPAYRPYYSHRIYDPFHRHYHAVYRFPVVRPEGVFYAPHVYCEGRLHVHGTVALGGPHLRVRLDF